MQRLVALALWIAATPAFTQMAQANDHGHKAEAHKEEPKKEAKAEAPAKDEGSESKDAPTSAAQRLDQKISCEKLPQKTEGDLWNLADCFFKIGVTNTTIEILRTIGNRNPKALDAFFTAAWLLWQDGRAAGGAEERKRTADAIGELEKARLLNPTNWEVDTEIGDFYYLRLNQPERAYSEYLKARSHYDGDYARNVPKASNGRKASIEDRIARTAERLDRKGEAVESSCRALFFDPDDPNAQERIKRLSGSCTKKDVKDPRLENNNKNEKEERENF